MNFLRSNKISHANWALNDKNEGASALINGTNGQGNWAENQLTPSGTLVKSIIKGWTF